MGITAAWLLLLSSATGGAPATPATPDPMPGIPGYQLVRNLNGCGLLVSADLDATQLEAIRKSVESIYWLGECRHGLRDGSGYEIDPRPETSGLFTIRESSFILGLPQITRYSIEPSAGVNSFSAGPAMEYSRRSEDMASIEVASMPVFWQQENPLEPIVNVNDGTRLNDFQFQRFYIDLANPANNTWRMMEINSVACSMAGKRIRGCRNNYNEFEVFGVRISETKGAVSSEDFTLCPDPKSPDSCAALWREKAAATMQEMLDFVADVRAGYVAERQALAEKSRVAEAALPPAWKAHWAAHPIDQSAIETARRCLQVTDLHPASIADAERIRAKYLAEPCRSSAIAGLSLANIETYLAIDAEGRSQRQQQLQQYAQARAERDAENAAAWGEFFGNVSTMIGAYASANAPAPAPVAVAPATATQDPGYQAYGQPAPSVAPRQPRTELLHRPELDATSCVSLVQLASGDPLSSYGNQVFRNACGQTVEVFWCRVGDECERGAGGTWSVSAGGSWPVASGQYYWGACLGANSGSLLKEPSRQFTGRYACTGAP